MVHTGRVIKTKANLSGLATLARKVANVVDSSRLFVIPPPLGPVYRHTVSVVLGRLNTTKGNPLVTKWAVSIENIAADPEVSLVKKTPRVLAMAMLLTTVALFIVAR